jgi:predicted transposase YdaD
MMFTEVREMRESTTFQGILDEGRMEGRKEGREAGLREAIPFVGELCFGPPDESVRRAVEAVHDIDQLKSLLRRARSAGDWSKLLNCSANG